MKWTYPARTVKSHYIVSGSQAICGRFIAFNTPATTKPDDDKLCRACVRELRERGIDE